MLGSLLSMQVSAQFIEYEDNVIVVIGYPEPVDGILAITYVGGGSRYSYEALTSGDWEVASRDVKAIRAKCDPNYANVTSTMSQSLRNEAALSLAQNLTTWQVITQKSFTITWADGGQEQYTASKSAPQSLGPPTAPTPGGDTGSCGTG